MYSGQSVLVDLHCVMVTVAVKYMVLVVVCATADKALAAKTINDEACILAVARCVCALKGGWSEAGKFRSVFLRFSRVRLCSICLTEWCEKDCVWCRPEFGKQNCERLAASSAGNPARNECELANGNCWLSRSKRERVGVVCLDI